MCQHVPAFRIVVEDSDLSIRDANTSGNYKVVLASYSTDTLKWTRTDGSQVLGFNPFHDLNDAFKDREDVKADPENEILYQHLFLRAFKLDIWAKTGQDFLIRFLKDPIE